MSASERRVFHKLHLVTHQLHKVADREIAAETKLTTAQAAILSVLDGQAGAKQRTIADTLGQNESAITAMVARLHRLGLISKTRSRTDKRIWRLTLTSTGQDTLSRTRRPFSKINDLIEAELSAIEIEILADQLDRIYRRAIKCQ